MCQQGYQQECQQECQQDIKHGNAGNTDHEGYDEYDPFGSDCYNDCTGNVTSGSSSSS